MDDYKEVAMARTIGALCTFIVGLQILVGVPLVVCIACFCVANGPITVEVHTGHGHAPQFVVHGATIPPPGPAFALAPPPNAIPAAAPVSHDNPILQSRAEHGSPLDGTVLESVNPVEEESHFVAALEKAAAEHPIQPSTNTCPAAVDRQPTFDPQAADRLIVSHLYEMADIDERSGDFARADQWRAFARGFHSTLTNKSEDTASSPVSTAKSETPTTDEGPALH
jgi:hypothetical protein